MLVIYFINVSNSSDLTLRTEYFMIIEYVLKMHQLVKEILMENLKFVYKMPLIFTA